VVSPVGTLFPVIGQRIMILGTERLYGMPPFFDLEADKKVEGRSDQGAKNGV
jgi:hypothetical protein